MKLTIKHQDSYSRGELILRGFFGPLYIALPHGFMLFFVGLWGAILGFISWWSILFTGRYPQSYFEFQVKLIRWRLRVNARMLNLVDGYPAFGLNATDDWTDFQMDYPDSLSRGNLLLKSFFGIVYILIPHMFVLIFINQIASIMMFLAWWAVLFNGRWPKLWHEFVVQFIRWRVRLDLYYPMWMSDDYPPFHGREDDDAPAPSPAVASPPVSTPDPAPGEPSGSDDDGDSGSGDAPAKPGTRPWSPTRPPRRADEEQTNPRNLDTAVKEKPAYRGILDE